jgi:hypothetical protein
MSDLICRKSMMRCQTPGMCSPHGGCRDEVTTAKDRQISALIAENERLTNRLEVDPRHDYDGISTRDATVKVLDEQVDQLKADNERLEVEVKRMTSIAYAAHGAFRMETMAERDQLRAEVAGLRTGYEAYEWVNAELKAEVGALRQIISDSATSCGAAVSVECTLDFMGHLPGEIFSVISKLRNALAECANSLQGEMLQKFGGQLPEDMRPVTRREYDRDMAEVAGYRAALGQGEQS